MLTMTSLYAQNNFGALIDASQREPAPVCAAQNLLANRPQPVAQAKKVTPHQVKDSLI